MNDSRDQVLTAMGDPTDVDAFPRSDYEILRYGVSSVTLSGGKVIGWSNLGNLNLRGPEKRNPSLALSPGSSSSDAVTKLGLPDSVTTDESTVTWRYDSAALTFEKDSLIAWTGADELGVTVESEPTDAKFIQEGMPEAQLFALVGTPDRLKRYSLSNRTVMSWGLSTVTLADGKVLEWINSGEIPVEEPEKSAAGGAVYLGDTDQRVKAVMGGPDRAHKYSKIGHETWGYGFSVMFFSSHKLSGWINRGELKIDEPGNLTTASLTMRSTPVQILQRMGAPDAVLRSPLKEGLQRWIYQSGTISIQDNAIRAWSSRGDLPITLGDADASKAGQQPQLKDSRDLLIAKLGTPWTIRKYDLTHKEIWSWQHASVLLNEKGVEKVIHSLGLRSGITGPQ